MIKHDILDQEVDAVTILCIMSIAAARLAMSDLRTERWTDILNEICAQCLTTIPALCNYMQSMISIALDIGVVNCR